MEKRTCLIEASEIRRAAALIRARELVAFPTETVYGLGANALDAAAVAKIFVAKGRPAESPLIVHVDSVEMARALVREWPAQADLLARRFWPGPLTLVLPKQPQVPDVLTAGLDTVGIRMPAFLSPRPARIASRNCRQPRRSTCAKVWVIAWRWCWTEAEPPLASNPPCFLSQARSRCCCDRGC
jgi:tRNA threonylcarbamoyl adenosine modification protein (Sua5/YciO/YrdC/YwlC family)